jgi:hypothetical protein
MKRDCTHCGKLRTPYCVDPPKCIQNNYSAFSPRQPDRRIGDRRTTDRRTAVR